MWPFASRRTAPPAPSPFVVHGRACPAERRAIVAPEALPQLMTAPPPEPTERSIFLELARCREERPKAPPRQVVAARVVAAFREFAGSDWFLSHEIEAGAAELCRDMGLEPLARSILLEAVAEVPGVRVKRARVKDNPDLAHLVPRLDRLRRKTGQKIEKPFLYYLGEPPIARPLLAESSESVREARKGRSGRPLDEPESGHTSGRGARSTPRRLRDVCKTLPAQAPTCGPDEIMAGYETRRAA